MTYSLYALEPHQKTVLKKLFEERLLSPQEYLSFYPGTTYADLGELCGCSESLVKKWFSAGKDHREPHRNHKLALGIAHQLIQRLEHQRRA